MNKRTLTVSLIALAIVAGATSFVSVAFAQTQDEINAANELTPAQQAAQPSALTSEQSQAAANAAANTVTDYKPTSTDSAYASVMTQIMKLFAWLVGVAALALDYSVYYTVVTMGSYVHNLTAIGVAWRILRDIGNIALIFGFLAIGISIILDTEQLGWGKKMLPMLLVGAVFLNFSMFFAEAIIDVGNVFATQFFTQINGGHLPTTMSVTVAGQTTPSVVLTNSAGTALTTGTEGISNKLMAQLGLQKLYSNAMDPGTGQQLLIGDAPWYIGFLGILLFIVTAFVMFSLAFILITRFIYLIYLIILSPLGFAGLAIPQLEGKAHKWWSSLFQQTITAPVLLLMLYVALTVITDTQFLVGFGVAGPGNANAATGFINNANLPGFASFILSFLVAMGLLIAVTVTAKSLSAFGADWATKTAGKLSFGATAWAGRNTVGWGANYFAKKARSSRLSRVPLVGTGIVKGLEKTASGSFDVRGVKAGGGLKGLDVAAGDAHKGGYKDDLKKRVETRTKYAADLKGKDFNDLPEEQQLKLAEQERKIEEFKKEKTGKQKAGTLDAAQLKDLNENIKKGENALDELHKEAGTERGAKLSYAAALADLPLGFKYLAANKDAAKKIKEEARKTKDDKDLDTLRKALKKAGGEEEPPAAAAGGSAPAGAAAPAGGAPTGH